MSNLSSFDASKVIADRPWYERALEAVAPSYALKRLEARVQRELFSYNASVTNRIYAPRTYGQPSESAQTTRSRVVMMWEARELVENVPQARAISRKFGQFLTPTEYSAATGDKTYNAQVNEFFHQWCKQCDISGRHSFRKLIQLACEERPVDGDCGFAIRRFDEGLKIQMIPATRIGNPNEIGAEDDNYFQGVIVDDFGRPIAYRIYRVTREGVYFGAEDVPASSFCHYFDPFRSDQMRGVTDFHCTERTIRMLNEILEAEKAGVRFASQQAALVFSDRGSANPRNLFTPGPPNQVLPNGQEQQNEFSQIATIRYFGTADKVEVMPSRPSNAFAGFIAHLMHEISIGTGIPQGVLFGTEDYSGPSVRAEFAAADRVFTRHQGVLQDKVLDPIKNAVLLDAIARQELPPPSLQSGETMVQALRRATRGEWRFPPKLTIDVGRESAANMAENRQGAKSLQEIAAQEGTDAFARLDQIAAEAAYIKDLSQKYDVPETAIRLVTSSLPSTPAAAAAVGDETADKASKAQSESITPQSAEPADTQPTEEATTASVPEGFIEINFADDTYVPTKEMASNAKRALEVRATKPPSQRGMTAVGLARARDLQNRKPLSEDTVRRMKAYFDRHEIDKKGEGWSQQGKGWQAWMGWGGDAGQTWANAIVERLNEREMSAKTKFAQEPVPRAPANPVTVAVKGEAASPTAWLDALVEYRRKLGMEIEHRNQRAMQAAAPVLDKPLVKFAEGKTDKKQFVMPTPNVDETDAAFVQRCMADSVMTAEYADTDQRYAVCQTQLKGKA
jgi:capsid protein